MVDGTKYSLAIVRNGRKTKTLCYGLQKKAYKDLIQFLDRINRQEWLLYQLIDRAQFRNHPAHDISSELAAILGMPGAVKQYAPVLDYHRFVPAFAEKLVDQE